MIGGNLRIVPSDFIRSMLREGFSQDEIYDVLTGAGIPWQEAQLLIERVEAELRGAGFEPRTSQMKRILDEALEETRREILSKIESISKQIEFLRIQNGRASAKKKFTRF